jgi:hypothetical protein
MQTIFFIYNFTAVGYQKGQTATTFEIRPVNKYDNKAMQNQYKPPVCFISSIINFPYANQQVIYKQITPRCNNGSFLVILIDRGCRTDGDKRLHLISQFLHSPRK